MAKKRNTPMVGDAMTLRQFNEERKVRIDGPVRRQHHAAVWLTRELLYGAEDIGSIANRP
jgi:hypothetical protein